MPAQVRRRIAGTRRGLCRLTALSAIGALAMSVLVVLLASPVTAAVPSLHAPAGLPRAIEPLAAYVEQTSCQPGYRRGTIYVARMLVNTYHGTTYGGAYDCGTDGTRSEHYDGRAVDWMNSVRTAQGAAQANSVLSFLLGTDRYGNKFANARRMGIMYVIWNNRIWGSWDGKWQAYNNCARAPSPSMDSACHRNHMHISMSWNGAIGRTSFWTKRVLNTTDYGPCRAKDLNWAGEYSSYNTRGCPSYAPVRAPAHSSAAMQALVSFSGASIYPGMGGGPVRAVQQALREPVTGRYDAATVSALNVFKRAHRLPTDGIINATTWRALLKAFQPH